MGYTFFLFSLVFSPRVDTVLMKTVKSFGDNPSDEYIIGIISDIKYDKGLLYIADMKENRVMIYDTLGNFVKQIGSPGQGPGELLNPEKIAIENDSIFVLNSGNSRIEIFDINGKPLGSFPFPRDRSSIIGEMYVYHNRVYLPVPGQDGLITVYTSSGNQIVRLGKGIPPPTNKDIKIWDSGIIIVYKDLIYVRENYLIKGPHVVTINSFSKTYAMCGLRIGYLWSLNQDLVNKVIEMKTHTSMNTNILAQEMAYEATKTSKSFIEKQLKIWRQRRDLIYKKLRALGLEVWEPEGAFYVFPKIKNSEDFVWNLFKKYKVITYPGEWFGARDRVRFSYALDVDKIEEGLRRVKKYLEKEGKIHL